MKQKRCIYTIVMCVFALGIIIACFYSRNNYGFWKITFWQGLTLLTAILISYGATQYKNDERKKKEQIEKIVNKIQLLVNDSRLYDLESQLHAVSIDECNKHITMTTRRITNCIIIMKQFDDELGLKQEIEYIENEIKSYKEFHANHMNDESYLSKSTNEFKKYLWNIDSKCDSIIVKLFS